MLQRAPIYAYIPAKDIVRARAFYEQKLGFEPKREVAGGVMYEFGDRTACFLYPTPNAGTSKASQAFWQVDDVEREVAELKARGVRFEEYDTPGLKTKDGIATSRGNKAAWFKDTEGNILALVQNL
ncbi:MAG TPA: VOC family protein [Gemmatimonadales bacterium]|nr:VOC family protein [Gemmatimonadales bacterium]